MIVPAAPDAPSSAPPPPPVPGGTRLATATSTSHTQPSPGATAAASFYAAKPIKKKKPKTGLIVGLSVGACAVAAGIYFWPTLMQKFKHEDQAAVLAAEAATNQPPPPPPPLTTEEILEKVGDAYKGMTDYAAKARTECSIDMSALIPGKGSINLTTTSSLQLGRTNYYRLEWEQSIGGKITKGAAWSAGKGNFVGYGPYPPSKVKTREDALLPASTGFYVLSGIVAELFFSETNDLAAQSKEFTKTNAPSVNGQDYYALTGEANHQTVLVWVNKNTFLIAEIQVVLGGTIPPEELKKYPSAQRNAMMAMSKLKGSITETYDNIQTNRNLLASAFESPYQPSANPNGQQMQSQRPTSMAGQLTNPGRRQRGGQ
jgi:hypothetical protein